MNELPTRSARSRLPWVAWTIGMLLLVATLTLTFLNSAEDDLLFVPLAVAMIIGYSTVGAVLASRDPRNLMGWLMIAIGVAFVLTGVSSEYAFYTFKTRPGALPFASFAALVSEALWLPIIAAVCLLATLFPTGRVPSSRWRFLPPAILGLLVLFLVGFALTPGSLEGIGFGTSITNPLGVELLEPVAEIAATIGGIGVLVGAPLSVAAVVMRYRRSRGEERQQIRWLAYVAGSTSLLILTGIVLAFVVGESFGESPVSEVFFLATFALIGIGVPVAMGVAVLKYRLYDLDLVVKKTVLYATVAALLTAIFLVVAVVIGAIAGRSDTGAVVAAAAIGLAFWPALRVARRIADRIVYGGRATPYEVLTEFSARVRGSYGAEDVLPRMAQILRDAVGASRATVWLRVGDRLQPAALAPNGDLPEPLRLEGDEIPPVDADSAVEVRDRGELLGVLAVTTSPNDPMNPSKERLVRDLASQAGLVLRNVRLIEELRASRQRIVSAQDERARKLERDIHDGAQQQLVALAVQLRLLEQQIERDPSAARAAASRLQAAATTALEDLRDLARGIYPPLLADKGLAVALEAQARKSAVPTAVASDGIGRYPQEVEAAVYFCVLEALQNVAKYADADTAQVRLAESKDGLTFSVRDDGVGFDPASARGSGLTNMRDRLEALGGDLDVRSAPGAGTTVTGRVAATATGAAAG